MYNLLLPDILQSIRLLEFDFHRHILLLLKFRASHFHIDLCRLREHQQHLCMNRESLLYKLESNRHQQCYCHHHKLHYWRLLVYHFHKLTDRLRVQGLELYIHRSLLLCKLLNSRHLGVYFHRHKVLLQYH